MCMFFFTFNFFIILHFTPHLFTFFTILFCFTYFTSLTVLSFSPFYIYTLPFYISYILTRFTSFPFLFYTLLFDFHFFVAFDPLFTFFFLNSFTSCYILYLQHLLPVVSTFFTCLPFTFLPIYILHFHIFHFAFTSFTVFLFITFFTFILFFF